MSLKSKVSATGGNVVDMPNSKSKNDKDPLLIFDFQDKPQLEPSALSGLAGDIINKVMPYTEADPAAILLQFLTAYGNAIKRHAYIYGGGQRHYGNLFCVIVGNTSVGCKGTSLAIVKQIYKLSERLKEWYGIAVTGGLSTGEGLIDEVRDPGEDDGDDSKSKSTSQGVEDKRRLITQSEFSTVLKVMTREGNTLPETLMQAWDDGNLRIMTKQNKVQCTDAHISLIGHITPKSFKKRLTAEEASNGFINRFLICSSFMSKPLSRTKQITSDIMGDSIKRLEQAVEFGQSEKEREMKFDQDAGDHWDKVYPELRRRPSNLYGEITSRAVAQVSRLALIYALLDQSPEIKLKHLQAALATWSYCEKSVKYYFGNSSSDSLADKVLDALKQAGSNGLVRTEIRDKVGRNTPGHQLANAIDSLHRDGQIEKIAQNSSGGRTAERFRKTDQ